MRQAAGLNMIEPSELFSDFLLLMCLTGLFLKVKDGTERTAVQCLCVAEGWFALSCPKLQSEAWNLVAAPFFLPSLSISFLSFHFLPFLLLSCQSS